MGMVSWVASTADGITYLLQRGDKADPIIAVDRNGKVLHKIASQPLEDRVPINGVPVGPRSIHWRPSAPATVSSPQRVLPNTGAQAGLVWLAVTAAASILAGTTLLLRRGSRIPLART